MMRPRAVTHIRSDPYIWSGAPLLAGWNAGAAYPLTLLFAVAPPVAAWTLNMILTWVIAGLGMFAFLRVCAWRACRASSVRCRSPSRGRCRPRWHTSGWYRA